MYINHCVRYPPSFTLFHIFCLRSALHDPPPKKAVTLRRKTLKLNWVTNPIGFDDDTREQTYRQKAHRWYVYNFQVRWRLLHQQPSCFCKYMSVTPTTLCSECEQVFLFCLPTSDTAQTISDVGFGVSCSANTTTKVMGTAIPPFFLAEEGSRFL